MRRNLPAFKARKPSSAKNTLPKQSDFLARRTSGILLHPTSLPGGHGVGDLGAGSRRLVDFLHAAKQSIWQMLPTGPTTREEADSPYSSFSAFAGNPLLISLDDLAKEGLLSKRDISQAVKGISFNKDRVDFALAHKVKSPLLHRAAAAFKGARVEKLLAQFIQQHTWVTPFAQFAALRAHFGTPREQWPTELRYSPKNAPKARAAAAQKTLNTLTEEIRAEIVIQYLFFKQWGALRDYALSKGVHLLGDLPIYISSDSADVWSYPEYFALDKESGAPELVSGVPPDLFNSNGQLWGHPIYNWRAIQKSDFVWWKERFTTLAAMFDIVRVDHFRGFESFWAVPLPAKNAKGGSWQPCPGKELFTSVRNHLGDLPIFIEDLGIITPEVHALREHFNFMGTRVLQFAFSGDPAGSTKSRHHTVNIPKNSIVYTGTHDNPPTAQWYGELPEKNRRKVCGLLNDCKPSEVSHQFIRLAMSSSANLCIFTMQDVLNGGKATRMNLPGTVSNRNWTWRLTELPSSAAETLAYFSEIFERNV